MREGGVGGVVDGAAFGLVEVGQERVPEDPALDKIHDVEFGPDDVALHAQPVHDRGREALATQCLHDAEFAINRVGRGQQLARRLAAQDIGLARRDQLVGRVGLSALELLDLERSGKPVDMGGHPLGQRRLVKGQRIHDRFGTGEAVVNLTHGFR